MKLSHNTAINFVGTILPTALTLLTLPPYLRLIGDIRFGVLTLVWLLLSYFGFFDMGLGKATSRYLASLRDADPKERESLFWSVLSVNVLFGILGGVLLFASGRVVLGFLKMPDSMRIEVISAMPWLGSAVPVATISSVMIGALEGRERFLTLNALQLFGACIFQLLPLGVAFLHGPNLSWLIGSAVIARSLSSIPMFFACMRYVPLRGSFRIERRYALHVCRFGGWVTVSDVLNLLLALDRFVIGSVRGAAALTYFAVPYSFSTKLLALPASFARTLFPRFAADPGERADDLASEAASALAILLTPVVMVALLFAGPFLRVWLGERMAIESGTACQFLLFGVWGNSLAYIPFALLNAKERPDLVAKFYAIEVLPFFAMLWFGLQLWGVKGAALAWAIRVFFDALLLYSAAGLVKRVALTLISATCLLGTCILLTHILQPDLASRFALALVSVAVCLLWARLTALVTLNKLLAGAAGLVQFARPSRVRYRPTEVGQGGE